MAGAPNHPRLETGRTSVQSTEVLEWLILELNVIYRQDFLLLVIKHLHQDTMSQYYTNYP